MIAPNVMQELIALGISIEIGPSDMYNQYKITVKKEQESTENSTITGAISYYQCLPNERVRDIERNTACVKFMMDKIFASQKFEAQQLEIENQQLLE